MASKTEMKKFKPTPPPRPPKRASISDDHNLNPFEEEPECSNPFGRDSTSHNQGSLNPGPSNPFADDSDEVVPGSASPPPSPPQKIPPPKLAKPSNLSFKNPVNSPDTDSSDMQRPSDLYKRPPDTITGMNPTYNNNNSSLKRKFSVRNTEDVSINKSTSVVDELYHKNHISTEWLIVTIILHIVQFSVLLTMAYRLLSPGQLAIILAFVVAAVVCIIVCRLMSKKVIRNVGWLSSNITSPDQETDYVPDIAIYFLSFGAVCEGVAFALFPAITAGKDEDKLNSSGFYSSNTMIQTLSFATITFYAMHRILRPANRLDPLRTVLEVSKLLIRPFFIDSYIFFMLFHLFDVNINIAA